MILFVGTQPVIAQFLGLRGRETLKQRPTGLRINGFRKTVAEFQALVAELYGCIQADRTGRSPSRENWRNTLQTSPSTQNKSPEVLLERAIARLADRGTLEGRERPLDELDFLGRGMRGASCQGRHGAAPVLNPAFPPPPRDARDGNRIRRGEPEGKHTSIAGGSNR